MLNNVMLNRIKVSLIAVLLSTTSITQAATPKPQAPGTTIKNFIALPEEGRAIYITGLAEGGLFNPLYFPNGACVGQKLNIGQVLAVGEQMIKHAEHPETVAAMPAATYFYVTAERVCLNLSRKSEL